jgi:N-acetylmuramoyl-L-alanine amidase
MRKFLGLGVVAAFIMIGYGLFSSGNTTPESQNSQSENDIAARLTAEAATPVPTMPIEAETGTDPVDGQVLSMTGDASERCFSGEPVQASPLAGQMIIVDPGHGGEDLGTVNMDYGLHESDFVLNISHLLRHRLTQNGADVCMTRIDDVFVSLADRAYFANENDGDVFVSIHLNSLPDPGENYTMAMWGNEAKDRFLAEKILEVLRFEMASPEFHNGEPNPMNPAIYAFDSLDSYMLKTTEMPAVLVEASFLSSSWEAKVLLDGIEDGSRWREHQIADAVRIGLENYFESFQ